MAINLRETQRPLKARYREDPTSAEITLTAKGGQSDTPIACNVDLGRAIYAAQAHPGVGGAGTGACSGDLLLGALAACAQLTTQMVAEAMGIPRRPAHEGGAVLRRALDPAHPATHADHLGLSGYSSTRLNASAAGSPPCRPVSAARARQSRARASGSRVWLAWARRAAILASRPALMST